MSLTINMNDNQPLDLSDGVINPNVREVKRLDNRSMKSKKSFNKSDKPAFIDESSDNKENPVYVPDDDNTYKIKLIDDRGHTPLQADLQAGPQAGEPKNNRIDHDESGRISPSIKVQGKAVPGIDYETDIVKKPENKSENRSDNKPVIPVVYESQSHRSDNSRKPEERKSEHNHEPERRSEHNREPERSSSNRNEQENSDVLRERELQRERDEERNRISELPISDLSPDEKQRRMEEALAKLQRLDDQGYSSSRVYGYTSKLEDVEKAVKKLTHQREMDKSVKWQRKALFFTSTVIEYLNERYDPFNINLSGWSESIFENLQEYDEVFEELYEKYHESVAMAPEIKLLGMVLGSALMFHFSRVIMQKAKKEMPGFEEVMNRNPELRRTYVEKAKEVAMNNGNNGNGNNSRNNGSSGPFEGGGIMGVVKNVMKGMGIDNNGNNTGQREVKKKMKDVDGLLGSLEKISNLKEESIEL